MRKFANGIFSICCLLLIGCDEGKQAFEWKHTERIDEIRHLVGAVCNCGRDRKPVEECLNTFAEVSAITNCEVRRQWLSVFCDAIANAKPGGADMLARQDNYTNLHNFREKASNGLGMKGDDLRVRLEMWFAEVETFQKEAAFCEGRAAEVRDAIKGKNPSKAKQSLNFNAALSMLGEWETSAQQCKRWHEYDMAPIILWDDSVAAKYCATLPHGEKMKVVHRIKDAIGRYPDWYLDEQKKGKKRVQKAGGTEKQQARAPTEEGVPGVLDVRE